MTETIIAATGWSKGKKGMEYPTRFVVVARKNNKGEIMEYTRYMQVKDGKNDQNFIYGHYYATFKDAYEDMMQSYRKNNSEFGPGNQSHMSSEGGFKRTGTYPRGKKWTF